MLLLIGRIETGERLRSCRRSAVSATGYVLGFTGRRERGVPALEVREARTDAEVEAAGRVTVAANAEFAPEDPDDPFVPGDPDPGPLPGSS